MRRSFFPLLMAVAFVASGLDFVAADDDAVENSVPKLHDDHSNRQLKETKTATEKEEYSSPSEEEARGATQVLNRIKSLLRRNPQKMEAAQLNTKGANEAMNKVNSIIGPGKTSTILTPEKLKSLETYARDNPDKWYAMAYYVNYVFGVSLVVTLLYGTFVLGWRPLGLGGPQYS